MIEKNKERRSANATLFIMISGILAIAKAYSRRHVHSI